MGLRLRWGIGAGMLAGMALLSGCQSDGGGTPAPKVLEHTTSQPPPGVVQYQQQQAKTAVQVEKMPTDK